MKLTRRLGLGLAFALLAATGCGGDGGGNAPYDCKVDEAALAEVTDCVDDSDCPCGAHCEVGLCAAACTRDSDCDDGFACDAFGRCRDDGRSLGAPIPDLDSVEGRLVTNDVAISLDGDQREGALIVRADGATLRPARVTADAPVSLRCPEATELAQECWFDELEAGQPPQVVGVVLTEVPTLATAYDVEVFAGQQFASVNVLASPTPMLRVDDTLAAELPLEGVWRGEATIIRSGSVARTLTSDTPETLQNIALPVELEIYPEAGVTRPVIMRDTTGLVFPEQETVGALLRSGGGELRLQHDARVYIDADADPATTDAVRVVASAQSSSVQRGDASLLIELRTTFRGIVGDDYAPFVDWRIAVHRTADLPAGAPVPTAPGAVAVPNAGTRAASPLLLEAYADTGDLAAALGASASGPARVQTALCAPAADPVVLSSSASSPWSGDLGCDNAAPFDQPLIFGAFREGSWNIATTIGECVADLERTHDISRGTAVASAATGCVDGARFAVAMAEAQAIDLRRAGGEAISPDETRSALAHRLAQQWVHMLAFVTSQATQIDVLNDVLGASALIARDFTQSDMLALTAAGWDLLLNPRIALPLTLMPGQVVRQPDYRTRLYPAGDYVIDARHDLDVGLPVAIARNLARSLDAHGALLERARFVTSESAATEALSVAFARRSIAVFAFATLLHDEARSAGVGDLPWAVQWEHASARYGIALGGLLRNLENLREGRNPLGIDDELDLPLYRVGDQVGDTARFSALTDYLLGTGSGGADTSPVGSAVVQAEDARDAARQSYVDALRTDQLYQITAQNQLNRRNAVREEFGEDIVSLCGDPDYDADLLIEGSQEVDAETCWIRSDCRRAVGERLETMHPEQLAYQICFAQETLDALGPWALPQAISLSPAESAPVMIASTTGLRGHRVVGGNVNAEMRDGVQITLDRAFFDPPAPAPGTPTLSPELTIEIHERCRAVMDKHRGLRPTSAVNNEGAPVTCSLHGDCPPGMLCQGAQCVVDNGTDLGPSCFRGAAGEVAVAMIGAATEIEIARSELGDLTRAYDKQMEICTALEDDDTERQKIVEAHLTTMTVLGTIKLAAEIGAHVAGATKDCASDFDATSAGTVATCGAAAYEAAFESVVSGMELGMEEATRRHEATLDQMDRDLAIETCKIEAEKEMIAVGTAVLRIRRASEDLAALVVQLENLKTQIRGTLAEGKEELAVQTSLEITPIEFDFWLDSNTVRYESAFRRARRAVYLGVIALEYEYQLSTGEREATLATTTVDGLREILTRLRNFAATGTVGGASPSNLHAVISLRDELLAVADRAEPGVHSLTKVERFRVMLADPQFDVRDDSGQFLGKELPFRLAPLSVVGSTDPGGVPLLTGADCAERLWSINASVLGSDVLNGSDSNRTRIEIRKRNSFYSQWCGGSVSGHEFQYASTRPSRNLFLDPFRDYMPGTGPVRPEDQSFEEAAEEDAFAKARLAPAIGVTRADLEDDAYFNGSSRELAGRGVYGEYTVFFPAEILSQAGEPGLDLEKIDDILLRIDYVSVAN